MSGGVYVMGWKGTFRLCYSGAHCNLYMDDDNDIHSARRVVKIKLQIMEGLGCPSNFSCAGEHAGKQMNRHDEVMRAVDK